MYLDNAATTPLTQDVKDYIYELVDMYGNPSSIHSVGLKTKNILEVARNNVANFINCESNQIYFTSSGSASNSLAIRGLSDDYCYYYSPTCHKSMLYACKDKPYNYELVVDKYGHIDTKYLDELLYPNNDMNFKMEVVCIECANSEIGTINNIKEISDIVKKHHAILILDCTGYIPYKNLDVNEIDCDYVITFSAHKLGAPKGVGVLCKHNDVKLTPLIFGSQENGLFGGTENIIGIGALSKAVELYDYSKITNFYIKYLFEQISNNILGVKLIGDSLDNRIPTNLYISIEGCKGVEISTLLDIQYDIQVSTGSACNSGDPTPSNTLVKIGVSDDLLFSCIRITLDKNEEYSFADLDYISNSIVQTVNILRLTVGGI